MPKTYRPIIVPYEQTLVTSLYPDSDLPTTVGSTIVSSGVPIILANPGRHPALYTFVNSPVGHATETRAWRYMMGVEEDFTHVQKYGVAIARSKNLFRVDGDAFTGECAKEASQVSAEWGIEHYRRLSNRFSFSEAAARFSHYYFQKSGEYQRQRLTRVWMAEQHLSLTQGEPPWHCPLCDYQLPYPLPSLICPDCGRAFTRDWPETRWTRPSVRNPVRTPRPPRWMELSIMQKHYAEKDPRYAHFLGCVLRAESEGRPGETQRQTVKRLSGFSYETMAAHYTRLGLELRR